ncbi:MAG: hypothetical protein FJ410_02870 [Verrucomicrobia bacterium]|nr:hypothetical protein [Verrucomicrobiota bacterium]
MKHRFTLLAGLTLLVVGCETPATYKDPEGRELVVSLGKVDIQDFANAGNAMLQEMVKSPAFDRADSVPVIQVGQITNDTATNFDLSLLLSKITGPLVNAGRVRLIDSDPVASAARASTQGAAVPVPQYVLRGKILEDRANAGRTKQSSFVFQLALIDVRTSLQVWQGEKIVTKQGTTNAVGF